MIRMPERSVTRFFIPLIDVLILMFGVFLLMPAIRAPGDEGSGSPLTAADRAELNNLRHEKQTWEDREKMRQELEKLRKEKLETLQQRLAIRVLEIGAQGQLYYYDPDRTTNRRVEITDNNVAELIRSQREDARGKELYFLIMYPRPASGISGFPLQAQREQYDRWFADVAHGYDIPVRSR